MQCDPESSDDFHRCEDGLTVELGKCFESCGGISSCIMGCTADYESGLKDCPCMEGCPNGCPCDNWDCADTVCVTILKTYMLTFTQCDPDESEDFHRCEDELAEELENCFVACGGNSSCIIACSADYENGLKNCPCMEGCPGGCPCDSWDCTRKVCHKST